MRVSIDIAVQPCEVMDVVIGEVVAVVVKQAGGGQRLNPVLAWFIAGLHT